MIRLSPSSKKPMLSRHRMHKKGGLFDVIKRITPSFLRKRVGAAVSAQPVRKKILSESAEHIKVPQLKDVLFKVEDIDEAIKHQDPLGLVKEIKKDVKPVPGIHDKHTKFVLYDPKHPFDVHPVSIEDIDLLQKQNPGYLRRTLHVYTPQEITISHTDLDKAVFPGKLNIFGTGETKIGNKIFNKPIAVFDDLGVYTEITPNNVDRVKALAAKRGTKIRIVEGAESPIKSPGTIASMFFTGQRPIQTISHRIQHGGIPSVVTSAWSLSPSSKLYWEKIRSGQLADVPISTHLTHGFLDIGLGRILPLYLSGKALGTAMKPGTTPEERKKQLKFLLFNALMPTMYTMPLPVWSLYSRAFESNPEQAQQAVQAVPGSYGIGNETGSYEDYYNPYANY